MPAATAAVLKIVLEDVRPQVMRRIVVPGSIRLDRLHLAIQAVMPWTNSHLYEIRIGDVGFGEPDPEGIFDGPLDASKVKLATALADIGRKSFRYLYDFGDSWEHKVTVEKIVPDVAPPTYMLLDARGRCPPQDCGGPPGYERLLQVLADPGDPDHEDMTMWAGGPIDPRAADTRSLEANLEDLAKRWTPKPKRPRVKTA